MAPLERHNAQWQYTEQKSACSNSYIETFKGSRVCPLFFFFFQYTREGSLNAEPLHFTPEQVVPRELLNVLRQAK